MNTIQTLLPKPPKPLGVFKEYMYYYHLCQQHFGRVVVLYQNGSFYEIFQPKHSDLLELSIIMTAKIAWKKSIKPEQPYNIGFPVSSKLKYTQILLQHSFTIVVIDQLGSTASGENFERRPTIVYSPGAVPLDSEFVFTERSQSILSIYASPNGLAAVSIDLQTGSILCSVCNNLESVYSFVNTINVSELSLFVHKDLEHSKDYSSDSLLIYLDLLNVQFKRSVVSLKLESLDIESVFQQVWPTVQTGMNNIVDHLGLTCYPTICLALFYTFNFINQRNPHYLRSIGTPTLVFEQDRMLLTTNTVNQLNIVPNKLFEKTSVCQNNRFNSLSSLIKPFVCTSIGRRALDDLLSRPLVSTTELNLRYNLSDRMGNLGLGSKLSKIYDIVRLCRRVSLDVVSVTELYQLKMSLETILDVSKSVGEVCSDIIDLDWVLCVTDTVSLFNRTCNLDCETQESPFFLPGVHPDLDSVSLQINDFKNQLNKVSEEYSALVDSNKQLFKLTYTEQDSWHLSSTRSRATVLQVNVKKHDQYRDDLEFFFMKNSCRIKSKRIDQISSQHSALLELYNTTFQSHYSAFTNQLESAFSEYIHKVVHFIQLVDLAHANHKMSTNYKYSRPILHNKDVSSVSFKALRNPLGERVSKTKWTCHDVSLGIDSSIGLLLYGINAAGKSMLLRSIGMCIVLAQSGFYVPCDSMEISLYTKIISQVELYDNFLKGQSSFMVEVAGIRNILSVSDSHSLVLADELCKGTESTSGAALLGSLLFTLVERKVSFLITTHLHQLSGVDLIQKLHGLRICHLSVSQNESGGIVFDRQLYDGGSSTLYGLKIAEYMNLDKTFINVAMGISDTITGVSDPSAGKFLVKPPGSRYNSKKKIVACEICKYTPTSKKHIPLDTHHIDFQCTADSNGFIDKYHKNELFNLVTLCKDCHVAVHSGTIEIHGYQTSSQGVVLSFTTLESSS
jgi:DNA mismatch repair protein MutS